MIAIHRIVRVIRYLARCQGAKVELMASCRSAGYYAPQSSEPLGTQECILVFHNTQTSFEQDFKMKAKSQHSRQDIGKREVAPVFRAL